MGGNRTILIFPAFCLTRFGGDILTTNNIIDKYAYYEDELHFSILKNVGQIWVALSTLENRGSLFEKGCEGFLKVFCGHKQLLNLICIQQ